MKSFLLSVLFCIGTIPLFAAPPNSYQLEFQDTRTGLSYERRFLFGIDIRTGGLSSIGPASPAFTTGISALNLSFTFPLVNNMTLQFQFRVGFPYSVVKGSLANTLPMIFQSSITSGLYLGIGGRVADWRNMETQKGWSIWMHTGIILDYGLQNLFITGTRPFTTSESLYTFFSIGGEINLQVVYSFAPRAAVSLGIYGDCRVSPFAGDPFYTAYQSLVASFVIVGFGFSVGFLF